MLASPFLGKGPISPHSSWDCPQPIKEEYLLTAPLEFANRAYAIANIAGIEMCWAYTRGVYLEAAPNIIRA